MCAGLGVVSVARIPASGRWFFSWGEIGSVLVNGLGEDLSENLLFRQRQQFIQGLPAVFQFGGIKHFLNNVPGLEYAAPRHMSVADSMPFVLKFPLPTESICCYYTEQ